MLASLDDINTHLPVDKLEADDSVTELLQVDARRIIKGYLSGVFPPATLAAWADPDTTPETIRGIAGRLIAAAYYTQRYAEDSPEAPAYAQTKYNEAIALLTRVQSGTIILEGITEASTETLTSADFWPNDTTTGPMFTIDEVL